MSSSLDGAFGQNLRQIPLFPVSLAFFASEKEGEKKFIMSRNSHPATFLQREQVRESLSGHGRTLKCMFIFERLRETRAGGQREPVGGINATF